MKIIHRNQTSFSHYFSRLCFVFRSWAKNIEVLLGFIYHCICVSIWGGMSHMSQRDNIYIHSLYIRKVGKLYYFLHHVLRMFTLAHLKKCLINMSCDLKRQTLLLVLSENILMGERFLPDYGMFTLNSKSCSLEYKTDKCYGNCTCIHLQADKGLALSL